MEKKQAQKPSAPRKTAPRRKKGPSTERPPEATEEQMLLASVVAELLRLANPNVNWGTAMAVMGFTKKKPVATTITPTVTAPNPTPIAEPLNQPAPPIETLESSKATKPSQTPLDVSPISVYEPPTVRSLRKEREREVEVEVEKRAGGNDAETGVGAETVENVEGSGDVEKAEVVEGGREKSEEEKKDGPTDQEECTGEDVVNKGPDEMGEKESLMGEKIVEGVDEEVKDGGNVEVKEAEVEKVEGDEGTKNVEVENRGRGEASAKRRLMTDEEFEELLKGVQAGKDKRDEKIERKSGEDLEEILDKASKKGKLLIYEEVDEVIREIEAEEKGKKEANGMAESRDPKNVEGESVLEPEVEVVKQDKVPRGLKNIQRKLVLRDEEEPHEETQEKDRQIGKVNANVDRLTAMMESFMMEFRAREAPQIIGGSAQTDRVQRPAAQESDMNPSDPPHQAMEERSEHPEESTGKDPKEATAPGSAPRRSQRKK